MMKVILKVKEVEIAKEVIRSGGWWRFACGNAFSRGTIICSIFLHAKARKSRQNGFRKNSVIRHKTDFTTTKQGKFLISSHLSCGDMWNSSKFGKNSHFSASIVWKKLKFLCMWRNLKFLHICHVLKSEIFSTWLIFLHLYIGDRGDKYQEWSQLTWRGIFLLRHPDRVWSLSAPLAGSADNRSIFFLQISKPP